jgi:leucyl-tRNA synthetase
LNLAVAVNGKTRDVIAVPLDADEKACQELALKSEKVQSFLVNKSIRKVIVVKGRIVNIVVA